MHSFFQITEKIDQCLGKVEQWVLVSLLFLMVFLAFLQVILRQFFSIGLLWADVFLRHCVLWVGFLGAAIATQEHKHFAIDFLKKLLSPAKKKWAELITNVFALACLFLLGGAAISFFKDEYTYPSTLFTIGTLEVPSFWMTAIIPIGFILLFIHFLLKLFHGVRS
jgi:TRAP-type C4-dicarboxylate transport system permease small subunit